MKSVFVCLVVLGSAPVSHLSKDPKLTKVKSAAKKLIHAGEKIKEDSRSDLLLTLQEHFSPSALTPDMILQAATMETQKENAKFVSHGFEVVRKVIEEGKISEFMKRCREHFVNTMKPKHLPHSWSVDHGHKGLKGKSLHVLDQL